MQSGEVSGDWKKGYVAPILKKDKKDSGNSQSVLGKIMGQNLLADVLRHMGDREVM